ncbi:hypothetical protein SAMN04487785_1034 [Dyella jiangningensis]|uniref:hypothetical protein n=1 Tax=Dyella sp. AtDHG13 TaxID=1938897 RepID=UPI00088C2496|nr:hypothetical protein [Dyella sp. AtDHG13]PXV61832.1 hypothetical protein BDW41_101579 [Dyella sp. AtDHG13]SDJ62370.1 hypothetical protein SAMN04487785_1034 [Dyella jiangningensis]
MGEARRQRERGQQGTTVGAHHVVIIEWLSVEERQTGSELANRIRPWNKCPVVLYTCKSAADVIAALNDALEDLKTTGHVPIVHFEAHGLAPDVHDNDGIAGPNGNGGTECLYWKRLAPLLGEINLHSRFRMLLLGAACHGINALDAIEITSRPAPFTALIGFNGIVHPRRLLEAMVALYGELLDGGHKILPKAIEVANRELSTSLGEELTLTTCRHFFLAAVATYVQKEMQPGYRAQENERLRLKLISERKIFTTAKVDQMFRTVLRNRLTEIVATFFAYEALPSNRRRFPINIGRIIREQEQLHNS